MKPQELKPKLKGVIVTPVVPMRDDGEVELASVRQMTRFLVDHGLRDGIGALVPLSSTGEFFSLSDAEFEAVLSTTVEAARGEVPVLAGTNHMDTAGAIHRSKRAQALGAAGVLVGPQFYRKPSREEILHHFRCVSDAVEIGVLIYNNAFATQYDLDIALLSELAELPNVVGMKESTVDNRKFYQVVETVGDRLAVLNGGCEWREPDGRLRGSPGFVSMIATVTPELSLQMEHLLRSGKYKEAADLQRRMRPLLDFVFARGGSSYIGALKAGLTLRGIPAGLPRPPLAGLQQQEIVKLAELLGDLGVASLAPESA